jgi:predicted Holliday junction resolvase-like endonuclease
MTVKDHVVPPRRGPVTVSQAHCRHRRLLSQLVNGTILAITVFVLMLIAIVVLAVKWYQAERRVHEVRQESRDREVEIRADARNRSRIAHMAAISEQIAPMTPGFPYSHKDVQWVGGVIDAVVWDGLEADGEVNVVFLDVKTGPFARLTADQRRVRDAIKDKRVTFAVYPMPGLLDGTRTPELLASEDPLAT